MGQVQLLVEFIANGDRCDPIQVINRIIEQLQLDFKRDQLVEFDVALGNFTAIDDDAHCLIHRAMECERHGDAERL